MAGGRPVKYKKEYDEKIIEVMKEGGSAVEFCAEVGIHKDTFYEWVKVYKSFSDAFSRARVLCQAWWERQGRNNLLDVSEYQGKTQKFNERLWTKNMACRFRDDWVETKQIAVSASTEEDKSLLEALLAKPGVVE